MLKDPGEEFEKVLLLTSQQATLLANTCAAATILEEFGLTSSPRIVINLIGDETNRGKAPRETAAEQERLVAFMQNVRAL